MPMPTTDFSVTSALRIIPRPPRMPGKKPKAGLPSTYRHRERTRTESVSKKSLLPPFIKGGRGGFSSGPLGNPPSPPFDTGGKRRRQELLRFPLSPITQQRAQDICLGIRAKRVLQFAGQ